MITSRSFLPPCFRVFINQTVHLKIPTFCISNALFFHLVILASFCCPLSHKWELHPSKLGLSCVQKWTYASVSSKNFVPPPARTVVPICQHFRHTRLFFGSVWHTIGQKALEVTLTTCEPKTARNCRLPISVVPL